LASPQFYFSLLFSQLGFNGPTGDFFQELKSQGGRDIRHVSSWIELDQVKTDNGCPEAVD
jgi:hypothetical protein